MEVRHVHFNLGQCHRQFGQREKPKHVSAPCPQNYKRRPRNWTPLGRIGEPRKSIRGKEMNSPTRSTPTRTRPVSTWKASSGRMAPFARSAATAIPSELRNSSSALIAFRGSELSRRLAQNSKVGILVVIESVVVAYPFLGGLHHRYARIEFSEATPSASAVL